MGGSSPHPQQAPVFHQCRATLLASGSFPQLETDGEGGACRDHPGENPSVFSLDTHPAAGWAPALILAHLHACPFLTARINPLANKHPANTQSLHKPSLTFSPY